MVYRAGHGKYLLIERPRLAAVREILNMSAWWGLKFLDWDPEWLPPWLEEEQKDGENTSNADKGSNDGGGLG